MTGGLNPGSGSGFFSWKRIRYRKNMDPNPVVEKRSLNYFFSWSTAWSISWFLPIVEACFLSFFLNLTFLLGRWILMNYQSKDTICESVIE